MDEITIGEKTYISSKQAAKITGYAKDYVGQLCREGRVEARLVGRNWYVLDSAIREHRFGKEEQEPEVRLQAAEPAAPVDRVSTWQTPQYKAEVPVLVPDFSGKAAETVGAPAIADMQSAWKEWFQDRQPVQEDVFASPEDESRDSGQEISPVFQQEAAPEEESGLLYGEEIVTISRIESVEVPAVEEDSSDSVDIQRIYSPRPSRTAIEKPLAVSPVLSNESLRTKARVESKKDAGAAVVQSLLLVISVAAVLVALIGTGHAEQYLAGTSLDFGVQKEVIEFLGGKSTYESSL